MYAAYGTNAITGTGPIGAQAPLTATDMQNVFTNSAYGINAKPLATSVTRGLGDVEFGVKVNVLDPFHGDDSARYSPHGFNWRQSFGGTYRLGTGTFPSPADFTAVGTGDHQSSVQVKSVPRSAVRSALFGFRSSRATPRRWRTSSRCEFRMHRHR